MALMQRAIEADATFAMAYDQAAKTAANVGDFERLHGYERQAFLLSEGHCRQSQCSGAEIAG